MKMKQFELITISDKTNNHPGNSSGTSNGQNICDIVRKTLHDRSDLIIKLLYIQIQAIAGSRQRVSFRIYHLPVK
jgi:hypothetical protein